jgi:hypothetical protein
MTEQAPHRMQRLTPRQRFLRIGVDILVVVLVLLNWFATQLIAALLRYAPFLMGRLVGHVYQPFAWWWWWHHWPRGTVQIGHNLISLERVWRLCERIIFYPTGALLVVGGLAAVVLSKWGTPADLHGSASWADSAEVKRTGL